MEPTYRKVAADVSNEELDAMIEKAKREILVREAEERDRKARAYLKQEQEQSS